MADLQETLKRWAADHAAEQWGEFVSSAHVTDAALHFSKGWEGTDVTPGEPSEFSVIYTITKDVEVKLDGEEITRFISQLVERA